MVEYKIYFSKQASKDALLLKSQGLEKRTKDILNILILNPLETPRSYERLKGNFEGLYSRRISYQHRLVYEIDELKKEIFILRMWTHYENI